MFDRNGDTTSNADEDDNTEFEVSGLTTDGGTVAWRMTYRLEADEMAYYTDAALANMNAEQKKAAKEAAKAPAVQPAAPVQQAAAAPAPQVEEGIPGDVIAAIMAAIHAMGNGKYTLKAVRRSKNGWGNAGVNDTTAPF